MLLEAHYRKITTTNLDADQIQLLNPLGQNTTLSFLRSLIQNYVDTYLIVCLALENLAEQTHEVDQLILSRQLNQSIL